MASEYGPFHSERDAWATAAGVRSIAAWEANPVPGEGERFNLRILLDDIGEIGLDLGAYDLSPLRQVAMYETQKCVALRGIIRRAYLAGQASRDEGTAGTEWGVLLDRGDGQPVVLARFEGEHAETDALTMASDHRPAWSVASRQVGPWVPVPGEEGSNG
jgi:hypothetical protein